MADIFQRSDVRNVLLNKKVVFLGDSILRNIYQDLVWLFEHGDFTPHRTLVDKHCCEILSLVIFSLIRGRRENSSEDSSFQMSFTQERVK